MASSSATHHLTADDARLQQAAGEALRSAGTPEDGFAAFLRIAQASPHFMGNLRSGFPEVFINPEPAAPTPPAAPPAPAQRHYPGLARTSRRRIIAVLKNTPALLELGPNGRSTL